MTETMHAPIVEFAGVTKRFGALTVLDDFNFSVAPGEKVTLIGPSGSGKSTVLRILMTLEPFQEGRLTLAGMSYHEPKGRARSRPPTRICARSAAMSAWSSRASICSRT